MKSPFVVVTLLAAFFMMLGMAWFACIQIRCEEINPRPVLLQAVSVEPTGPTDPPVRKYRSPHAKPYHDILFWSIAVSEVFVSVFYVMAGIFLIKRFHLAKFMATFAVILHLLFVIVVIGFMKWGAIPLSQLTHNENMLQLYFLPSPQMYNIFSGFVTGYQAYLPGGIFYVIGLAAYFYGCFFIFSRPDVKSYLTPPKKVKMVREVV